jgi:hypothetical protein
MKLDSILSEEEIYDKFFQKNTSLYTVFVTIILYAFCK